MKILIAGLTKKNQFQRIKSEGEKKGHTVEGCLAKDLIMTGSEGEFRPNLANGNELTSYDLIYMIVGKRLWEWFTAAEYLNKTYGTIIVNQKSIDPTYQYRLTPASDYLKQTESNIPYPKSAVIFSKKGASKVIDQFDFPVILKSSLGHRGEGVEKIKDKSDLLVRCDELTKGAAAVVIRELIPNDGDIRVFTVGYKAIGAMKRTPKAGEFRSNISLGGSGEVYNLNIHPGVVNLAEKISTITKTQIAGVDIIIHKETGKLYVLEVNPGPQFDGLEKYTKVNAAGKIIEYFESLV